MKAAHNKRYFAMAVIALLAACAPSQPPAGPAEITASTACDLDGMVLSEYPGPKGQLLYADDKNPLFFCDTLELFNVILKPEQKRQIQAIYVQDMSKTDWDNPKGAWMDARTAFYVVGSSKHGSMGPTIGSFSSEPDAQKFATQFGGKVYAFAEMKPDMAVLDGGALHDKQM